MRDELKLKELIEGEVYVNEDLLTMYATDASAYKELPSAVIFPQSIDDIREIIKYALESGESLIPRTAGTSLAGKVVGKGIVVDQSKLNNIIELN